MANTLNIQKPCPCGRTLPINSSMARVFCDECSRARRTESQNRANRARRTKQIYKQMGKVIKNNYYIYNHKMMHDSGDIEINPKQDKAYLKF